MKKNNRKVSKILINKKFQLSTIGVFSLVGLLASSSYIYVAYLFFAKFEKMGKFYGFDKGSSFYKFLAKQEDFIFTSFGLTFLVSSILFLVIGFKYSHKAAGPLYRLNVHLLEMLEDSKNSKDMKKISFRDGDYFREIEENLILYIEQENNNKDFEKKVS